MRIIIENNTQLNLNYNKIIKETELLCRITATNKMIFYLKEQIAQIEVEATCYRENQTLLIKINYA